MNENAKYPNAAGHRGIDTSIAAAEDLQPRLGRLQVMVLGAIRAAGANGLTADECCEALDLDRWTVQPRTSELREKGLVADSGKRRRNRTGKAAIVWTLPEFVLPAPEREAA